MCSLIAFKNVGMSLFRGGHAAGCWTCLPCTTRHIAWRRCWRRFRWGGPKAKEIGRHLHPSQLNPNSLRCTQFGSGLRCSQLGEGAENPIVDQQQAIVHVCVHSLAFSCLFHPFPVQPFRAFKPRRGMFFSGKVHE